jgi:hypothetical protein
MKKTKELLIQERFVNEVPVMGDFSIIEPSGTFDGIDNSPAQLHIQFNDDDWIKFSIQNISHPRGKIVKKIKGAFTLGSLVETMAVGLGDESEVTNPDDTSGYHVHWWNLKRSTAWVDDLLIISRVFPQLAKALMPLAVVDVICLQERWGGSLDNGIDEIREFAYGLEEVDGLSEFNFSLAQLGRLVEVSDPLNLEEIGNRLQDIESDNLIIPPEWKRRQVNVRRSRIRRKPTTLLEIAACNSKQHLIDLLNGPPPTSLE